MNSIAKYSRKRNNTEDSKSHSTIQLEFTESVAQMQTTTFDNSSNSYSSFQQHYSRKRRDNEKPIDEKVNINKKQRSHSDHFTLSANTRNQQIVSLSESNKIHQQNELTSKRSVSIQNHTEINQFDWFKDFMRQSMDTIRDTVVQACITAISAQSMTLLNANTPTRDINVNNHLTRLVQSEHSLTSHKTIHHSWQNHRLEIPSMIRQTNDDDYTGRKQRTHQRARTSPYPMYKHILRTLVNDKQVPWSYEWPQYKPIIFTAEEIYINPGADPDLFKSSSSISLHFNTVDGAIDRRSVYHAYQLNEHDGLPLNPIGRTGLQGRGILLRWGPNIYHYVMICRWKRDIHGRILLHPLNGKKLLEILLEIQTDGYDTNNFILTGGLRMLGSRFPPQLQDRLKRFVVHTGSIFNNRNKTPLALMALDHLFEQSPVPWKGAYFDDARNTDNAWIELSIEYLLDYDHRFTSCIPSLNNEQLHRLEQPRFVWKDVRSTIDVGPRTHYRLIRNLAYKLDAYF